VEFTGVELTAPVEKAVTGSVEKAMRQPVSTVEREEDGRLSSGAEEKEDGNRPVMVGWCGRDVACRSGASAAACSRCCMARCCECGGDTRTETTTKYRKVRVEIFFE
jgi:hypothetical protein